MNQAGKRARRFGRGLAAATVLVGGLLGLGVAPASAAPSLSVSPAAGLNPDGAYVVATGRGYLPNAQLFVMQCRANSAEDHTCNSVGLQKVMTDGAGNFQSRPIRVVARFGATDCTTMPCAVKTSTVSGHSGDRTQDVAVAISFAAAPTTQPPATQPPATQPPATQPPATQAPVTDPAAPPASDPAASTTTVAVTTTTVAATTTTAAEQGATTTTAASGATKAASGSDDGTSSDGTLSASGIVADEDDSSSSSDGMSTGTKVVLGLLGLVIVAAAGGGLAYYLRSRPTTGASGIGGGSAEPNTAS